MSAHPKDPRTITSHDEFRRLFPRLVVQQDERPELALAALANPILALEELGYSFAPEVRPHMERLARFGEARTAEIEKIEARLAAAVGSEVDLSDRKALSAAIVARLPKDLTAPEPSEPPGKKLPTGAANRMAVQRGRSEAAPEPRAERRIGDLLAEPLQRRFDGFAPARDPLASLKGREPLLDDLLRLREIEGSRARLAEPEVFRAILTGKIKTPITRVRFVPKAGGDTPEKG